MYELQGGSRSRGRGGLCVLFSPWPGLSGYQPGPWKSWGFRYQEYLDSDLQKPQWVERPGSLTAVCSFSCVSNVSNWNGIKPEPDPDLGTWALGSWDQYLLASLGFLGHWRDCFHRWGVLKFNESAISDLAGPDADRLDLESQLLSSLAVWPWPHHLSESQFPTCKWEVTTHFIVSVRLNLDKALIIVSGTSISS